LWVWWCPVFKFLCCRIFWNNKLEFGWMWL